MRLVLLDRDGVINEDSPNHIKSVNEWLPYAGSIEAIARLKQHGVKVAICTNQSGIGLGLFSLAELNAIHAALHAAVRDAAGSLDGIFFVHICLMPVAHAGNRRRGCWLRRCGSSARHLSKRCHR
jgi:D-glycero-D-manno-heptose 1,7-bisphosphate phosphatase